MSIIILNKMGKLTLYIAASLDGFIAAENDNLDFLSKVALEGEDYGYHDFVSSVDTVILGKNTYDWVMKHVDEFPHVNKKSFVITSKKMDPIGNTTFYNGELKELVESLKSNQDSHIFCDGGAQIVNQLLKLKQIDEIILSIIPIILGNGTRLFHENNPSIDLELISNKSFASGLVQLHYKQK